MNDLNNEEIIDNENVEVVDKLIEPEESYINEFKRDIQKMGFKIVKQGKTFSGRIHFQILSNEGDKDNADLKYYAQQLDRIEDKFNRYKIPMTYSIGLQYDGYISAGVDLDKQYVKDSIEDGNEAKRKELEKDIDRVEKDLQEHLKNKQNTSEWMKRKVFLESTVARYKKQLSQLKDSIKDEAIYKWMADPEDEQDLIDKAKKLGCQLQKVGSLIQVTGPISKIAKVLGESEESIVKASQQRMSTIKKVKDVDTYEEVTQELKKETKKLDSAKVLKLINIAKKAKVVKDSNLGKSKLNVGQKVHLDPTKNSRASKEALEATYEVVGFWYQGKLVTQDPVTKQEHLDLSGVLIKNISNGVKSSVNRFQLMDSKVKDSLDKTYKPGEKVKISNGFNLKREIVTVKKDTGSYLLTEDGRKINKAAIVDSCKDDMELSAKTSEELDNLMKQYQKKHPTWKFGEIKKDKGLYRCSVIKN